MQNDKIDKKCGYLEKNARLCLDKGNCNLPHKEQDKEFSTNCWFVCKRHIWERKKFDEKHKKMSELKGNFALSEGVSLPWQKCLYMIKYET